MNQFKDWKTNMDRFFGHEFWDDFDGMMKPPFQLSTSINMTRSSYAM